MKGRGYVCAALLGIGCLVAACEAHAVLPQSSEVHGFRRAAFLARGMGARPVGMGEAFTAVADDASAISWNPGGIGQITSLQAVAMYDAVGNGLGLSYAAAAMPLGDGVTAISLAIMNYGTFDWRDPNGNPGLSPGGAVDSAISVAYAFPTPRELGVWSGIAVERVTEAVGGSFVGFSAGMIIPYGPQLTFGWAVQHLGQEVDGFSLPSVAKAGVSFLPTSSLRLALDVGYGLAEEQPGIGMAVGGEFMTSSSLALRAGYKVTGEGQELEGLTGLLAGAGFQFGRLGVDYAYQPFGDLALSHRIALRYELEVSKAATQRGEWASRRVAVSTLEPKPGHLYRLEEEEAVGARGGVWQLGWRDADKEYEAAVKLYNAGNYDDAWRKAAAAIEASPKHWQAWQMVGNCQYAKGDKAGALTSYRYALKLNPDNPELKAWIEQLAQ